MTETNAQMAARLSKFVKTCEQELAWWDHARRVEESRGVGSAIAEGVVTVLHGILPGLHNWAARLEEPSGQGR